MKILVILSFIVFVLYLAISAKIFKFKIPSSLSETFYLYQDKDKCGYIFSAIIIICGSLILPAWLKMAEGNPYQFLAFLCPLSILFVGAAPNFNGVDMESKIHPIAAILCAICSLSWILFIAHLWWIVLIFIAIFGVLSYFSKSYKSSYVFWIEMVIFFSTYMTLFIA